MISPSLHPEPVRAAFQRRRRMGLGLTPLAITLLLFGFVWLIPGLWYWRVAFAMLAWDALILIAVLLDGLRLPRPNQFVGERSWSNAPSLDSQTEIELTIENGGRTIVLCRLVDDLPPALVALPATQRFTAFPRGPA